MKPRLIAEKLAWGATRQIGLRWGESLPFYYVSEHPKSGGSWLAGMVADYLQIPFPRRPLLPIAFPSVLQNHWRHDPRMRRVLYLYRDGRDVMTSLYFYRVHTARSSRYSGRDTVRRTYEGLLGKEYDTRDVVRHLPRFIEFEFTHPGRGTPLNWRDHIADWVRPGRDGAVTYLSYEQLTQDCAAALGRALAVLTGEEADPWRLAATVEKMSMKRQTGREPGEADDRHFIRKGIVGDWRNHFSREAAEVFDRHAGDTLVELGYEPDSAWLDRYDFVT